jgi:hypothetical protein
VIVLIAVLSTTYRIWVSTVNQHRVKIRRGHRIRKNTEFRDNIIEFTENTDTKGNIGFPMFSTNSVSSALSAPFTNSMSSVNSVYLQISEFCALCEFCALYELCTSSKSCALYEFCILDISVVNYFRIIIIL